MYKRVTHTILEEHFSHPMAGEIKEALERGSLTTKYRQTEPVSANKFKLDIENYLANFNSKLHTIFENVAANDDTALAENEKVLLEELDTLGNMYKTYYGLEFGERLNHYFRTAVILFIALARNLKDKTDTRDWRIRLDNNKFDIANLLYAYNNIWRVQDTQGVIGQTFTEIGKHAQAVIAKDATEATRSYDTASGLLKALATILSSGTIRQYPAKFI